MLPTGLAMDIDRMIDRHYWNASRALPFPNSYAHIDDSGFYRNILTDTEEHLRNLVYMGIALKDDVVLQRLGSQSYVSRDFRNMQQEFRRIEIALRKVLEARKEALRLNRGQLDGLYLNNYWRGVVKQQRDIVRKSSDKASKHFLAFVMLVYMVQTVAEC